MLAFFRLTALLRNVKLATNSKALAFLNVMEEEEVSLLEVIGILAPLCQH